MAKLVRIRKKEVFKLKRRNQTRFAVQTTTSSRTHGLKQVLVFSQVDTVITSVT